MKKIFFILTALLLHVSVLYSQEITFKATAPSSVVKGSQFSIVYTLNSEGGTGLRAPEFEGCTVLYGPASSVMRSTTIINNKRESQTTTTYTYTVQAGEEGTFTIAPATIKVDGDQYTSNALTLKVLPPDKASEAEAAANGGDEVAANQLFMRLIVSRTKVYEQQPLLATVKLYTRAEGIQLEGVNFPSFEGFVVQEIEQPENTSFQLENYDGLNYKTAVLKQYLLFPQRTGQLTIEQGKYDMIVQVPKAIDNMRSFFGSSMNMYTNVRKTIYSPKVTVDVEELPFGKPASYLGGVGEFKLESTLSSTTVKANEAITLKMVISGNGNLKYIKNPEITFPADFEVYDPKVDLNIKATQSGVVGTRTIEYTVVPRFGGEFTIPAVDFSYFDLKSKSYKTLSTPSYTVTVEKGENEGTVSGTTGSVSNFVNKEQLSLLNSDIRFIKQTKPQLTLTPHYLFGSWAYMLFYLLPLLGCVALLFLYQKQAKANADIALMKNRKANKVASKRLKQAGVYLKQQSKEQFYDEVLKATWGYLSDKLGLPVSSLTKDNVEQELQSYGASTELIAQFMEILNTCEFARYAPSQSEDAMDKLYQKAVSSISEMENRVKK